jgi:hypothetical protein
MEEEHDYTLESLALIAMLEKFEPVSFIHDRYVELKWKHAAAYIFAVRNPPVFFANYGKDGYKQCSLERMLCRIAPMCH